MSEMSAAVRGYRPGMYLVRFFRRRFTPRGRYVLAATGVAALVGVDTRRSHVFLLFAIGAGALICAAVASGRRRPALRLESSLPGRATALEPVSVRARVANAGTRNMRDVRLALPRAPQAADFRVEPWEAYVTLGPGESVVVPATLLPQRRGRYVMSGARASRTDPLRLMAGRGVALPDSVLLVYPRFATLSDFAVPAGRRYQPGGIPLSSSTGDAIEFVGTREYRHGDPVRHIHWRSWARRGEPVVKEYQEEYFSRLALVLDTFLPRRPSTRDQAGFEAAVSVLASIADHFSRTEYVVDILAAGPDLYEVSAGRSLAYLENILDVLACLEPCHDPPFHSVAPVLFERLGQITSVVAVLLDWDEGRQAFLRRVKALGTSVRTLIVREGETRTDWRAAEELGEVSRLSPPEVERSLAAGLRSGGVARTVRDGSPGGARA